MIDLLPVLLGDFGGMISLCPCLRAFVAIIVLCCAVKLAYFLMLPKR